MAQLKATLAPRSLKSFSGLFQQTIRKNGPMLAMQKMTFADERSGVPGEETTRSLSTSDDTYKSRMVEFSSSRSRDLMGRAIDIQQDNQSSLQHCQHETAAVHEAVEGSDSHVESYDTHGNLSLHSAMQTMVPEPFNTQGKRSPTHLNMPGGHLAQGQKYLSDDLQKTHYRQNGREHDGKGTSLRRNGPPVNWHLHDFRALGATARSHCLNHCSVAFLSTFRLLTFRDVKDSINLTRCYSNESEENLSQRSKLKRAIKEYGSTVVVFHVSISLVSLGGFYLAVSSGVDVTRILAMLPIDSSLLESKLAAGVGTFALAYAVHKVFAPVRIAITLASTPFIVHYLRRIGFLKQPKK